MWNLSQFWAIILTPTAGALLKMVGKYIVSEGGTASKIVATKTHWLPNTSHTYTV